MKNYKLISVILSLTMCVVLLSACTQSNGVEVNMSNEKAIEFAKSDAQMLVDENYDEVYAKFSKLVKTSVSKEALSSSWVNMSKPLGLFKEIENVICSASTGNFKTQSKIIFEKGALALTITYDAKGEIVGIFIAPTSGEVKLEETDNYIETYLEVGEYKLDGILTTPKNTDSYPIVIMVQGSGVSDYDETIGANQNKPFKQIAHALAENGVATLRYTKRYYQMPSLANSDTTIYDEYMDDVYWLINYADKNITDDIYVLGHSLGGMSAPKIASDNPNVKGIIMLAGTSRTLSEVMYSQNLKAIEDMDTTSTQKDYFFKLAKENLEVANSFKQGDTGNAFGVDANYWISLATLDTENILNSLQIPVLIMQGDKDFQVTVKEDYNKLKNDLSAKTNVTFKLYSGLNHLFMPQTLKDDKIDLAEYDPENYIPQEVTDDISNWIRTN